MIQALAAEAAEEALADRVQVGRAGWDRDHVHIRACGGRGEVAPELAIVVPDQEPRGAVVRRSLSELLSDPRIGRGAGDVDVDDLAGPGGDDKERVDRAEPGVVELQDIAGPDVVRVVPEEGPPGLAVLPARTDGPHVLLDRPLAHADAEREQFAADPFGAPQPVGSGHGLDQVDELHAQPPPCPPPPGRMVPEEGEQVAMPAEEGVGLDHLEGIAPRGVQPGQEHQDKPVLSVEAWARWRRASEYEDLLAEERVLGDKRRAGPDGVDADRAHQRCPSADGPQHVRDGPATFVDASTDGRLDGPGQPVQHAGLLSHRVLGSRGRGTRFSQQRLTALRRKPLLCGWTGQVASTVVALLHDFDYERFPTPADHPFRGCEELQRRGYPDWVMRAILSHADYSGISRNSRLEKTLYACDEMAGFVTAASLVRPSKSILDLEARSVLKRMKDKAFARAVSRDDLRRGAAELELPLETHVSNVINFMRDQADALGLRGTSTAPSLREGEKSKT